MGMNPILNRRRSILVVLLGLALGGCSAPKLTPSNWSQFERWEKEQGFAHARKLDPSPNTRTPLKSGQWAVLSIRPVGEEGDATLVKYKVLSVQGKTVTLEIENLSASRGLTEKLIQAMVIDNFPISPPLTGTKQEMVTLMDRLDFLKVITKQGQNAPYETPRELLGITKSSLKNTLASSVTYRTSNITQSGCKTPWLESSKCLKFQFEGQAMGYTSTGTVEAHGQVPIFGFVSQVTDRSRSRVIAFGDQGAQGILLR